MVSEDMICLEGGGVMARRVHVRLVTRYVGNGIDLSERERSAVVYLLDVG